MTALIPRYLTPENGIPIPKPETGFEYQGPPPDQVKSDADYDKLWGPDFVANLPILQPGQSVLVPGLCRRGARRTWNRIRGYVSRYRFSFVIRQQAEGLRIWRVR